jgi:hypothetical protein
MNQFRFFSIGGMVFLFSLLLFSRCSLLNPDEPIPAYIKIDRIDLTVAGGQGSASHKITDAWVYVDGQLIGAFELPCTFPVIAAEGSHDIIVRAGIKMNGTSTTRAMYPFYRGYDATVTLTPGQVTTLNPVVTYFSGTNFLWIEDFEQPGLSLTDAPGSNFPNILQTISGPLAFESKSGAIQLNTDTFNMLLYSSIPYLLNATSPIYLELNYRSNNAFTVGIYNNTILYAPWVNVNPSGEWNKVYINITDAITNISSGGNYHIYFAMQKEPSVTEPFLYLDNIKLLK